jgi:aryl-alcohol dehydrogenase-like predicted oxidoreductase
LCWNHDTIAGTEGHAMKYVRLGKSGLKVSEICLGTMTFGREASIEESFRIMDFFVDRGGTFLDTANAYSNGGSEKVLGSWLSQRGNRNSLIIATKVYGRMGSGENDAGLSRNHIFDAIDASLERLGTDYIDIYQIHRWDNEAPPEETIGALDDLVRSGKVRYVACSNLKGWHLNLYLKIADEKLKNRFVSIQPVYNALNRGIELEVLPICEREGLGVIPYNPLAGGMLTGKYSRGGELPDGARLTVNGGYHARYYTDQTFDIVERFMEHAKQLGVTPAQLALAWSMSEPRITAPILGARSLEQIEDSIQGVDIELTPEGRAAVPSVLAGRWVGVDPVYDREEA